MTVQISAEANIDIISLDGIANVFDCSDNFARNLMRQLCIPKRGGGYSTRRLLVSLGFVENLPLYLLRTEAAQQTLMVNTQNLAELTNESPRNSRRRLEGKHNDKTFPQVIHAGASKRLVFKAELEAWLHCKEIPFVRDPLKVHSIFARTQKKLDRQANDTSPMNVSKGAFTTQVSSLFERPTTT